MTTLLKYIKQGYGWLKDKQNRLEFMLYGMIIVLCIMLVLAVLRATFAVFGGI